MALPLFTGLDCGGTGCRLGIAAEGGSTLWVGAGGPSNIATTDFSELEAAVHSALASACARGAITLEEYRGRNAGVYAGCAGWSAVEKRAQFKSLLHRITGCHNIWIVPDYELAHVAATAGNPGIVLSAGTGCVASATEIGGTIVRQDGLGWLLGDRGSAFHIGMLALRYASAQLQASEEPDLFTRAVMECTGADSLSALLSVVYSDFKPSAIAALAPCVTAQAETGQPAARQIVMDAVMAQRDTVTCLHQRVYGQARVPVWLTGGLMKPGSLVRESLESCLMALGFEVRDVERTAVEAAVGMAKRLVEEKRL
jgi:glucosamine kinase